MPLIACPDCHRLISDAAPACLYCGRPNTPEPAVEGGIYTRPAATNREVVRCAKCAQPLNFENVWRGGRVFCPCGAKYYFTPPVKKTEPKWILVFGAVVLCLVVLGGLMDRLGVDPTTASPVDNNTASMAEAMCNTFVQQRLKAPSTADFDYGASEAVQIDSLTWHARGAVDAENSFSAKIRSHYSCRLRYHPDGDRWELLDININ